MTRTHTVVSTLFATSLLVNCAHDQEKVRVWPARPSAIDVTTTAPKGWVPVRHEGRWTIYVPADFRPVPWNVESMVMLEPPGGPWKPSVIFGLGAAHRQGRPRRDCIVGSERCSVYEERSIEPVKNAEQFYISVAVPELDREMVIMVQCGGSVNDAPTCRTIVGTLRRETTIGN